MELSSLTAFFIYKVFVDVAVKFCQNPDLCRKVKSVQISQIQQPDQVSMALTRMSLTVWSHKMNHRMAERLN
jgi:hypothetical protein